MEYGRIHGGKQRDKGRSRYPLKYLSECMDGLPEEI